MLEIINLKKMYNGQSLLNGISFRIDGGETVCLLGASGSGKSTILRIISGLEKADSGEVLWQGSNLKTIPVNQRGFGLMFQDYALFPHLDVFANVAFGLKMQNLGNKEIEMRVVDILRQVNLTEFAHRSITGLSGGEQQRVALARALAPHPRLLMLDEPLGALDRALREGLINELRGILHESGVPAIYVTHDQQEAFTIADKIILLHDGLVAQAGSASEVFNHPVNPWVASFLGLGNLLGGVTTPDGVNTALGIFPCAHTKPAREEVTLLLRPQAVMADSEPSIIGNVADVIFRGQDYRVELENGLYFYLEPAPSIGQSIRVRPLQVECL